MPHTVLLAEPRGFCAGVVRAIDVLEQVLDREDGPVYAFHEIVHNRSVVDSFRARGAIFIDEIDEVPEGSRIVFSPTASRRPSSRLQSGVSCASSTPHVRS